jgi:ubiquinone biosynthesis protein UbiJ
MFPGPTLLSAASAIVETALNQALEFDPAGRKALLAALTAPVQFDLTTPIALTLTLTQGAKGVLVGSQPATQPGMASGDTSAIQDGRLSISGDTALAHQFQRAIEQLNPDWEAAMARHLGDVPAHFLAKRLRNGAKWSRDARHSMVSNLEEYLHEETGALPGRRELEASFQDIDALSLRVERLAARVAFLPQSQPPSLPSESSEKQENS